MNLYCKLSPRSLRLVSAGVLVGAALLHPLALRADTLLWNDTYAVGTWTNANSGWVVLKQSGLLHPPSSGTIRVIMSGSYCQRDACIGGSHCIYASQSHVKVDILDANNAVVATNGGNTFQYYQSTLEYDFYSNGAPFQVRISASSNANPYCDADYVTLYNYQVYLQPPPPPETISTPTKPTGPNVGHPATRYHYVSGGAASNLGHPVEYRYVWGDGSTTGWLSGGQADAYHKWASRGTYSVQVDAHCSIHVNVRSGWSAVKTVTIQ